MAEPTTTPVVVQQSGSSIGYWIGGIFIVGVAGFAAWYFLIKKPKDETAANSGGAEDANVGNNASIDEPEDTTKTTSSFAEKEKVEKVDPNIQHTSSSVQSSAPKVDSTASGIPLDTMVKVNSVDSIAKSKGKADFAMGQLVKTNGKQSVQRMKKNKSGQVSDKNDNGKLIGYSKFKDGEKVGTVEVKYDGGMVIKAPAAYLYPYYYVKYSQVK